jgi:hypothetical protein
VDFFVMSEPPFPGGSSPAAEETPADSGSGLLLIVFFCFVLGFLLGLAVALIVYWNLGETSATQQARIEELEQRLRDLRQTPKAERKPAPKAQPKPEAPPAESPSKKPSETESHETAPLLRPVTARLVDKRFRKLDLFGAGEEDAIALSLVLTNHTARDIEAFRGVVRFTDRFGQPVMTAGFDYNDGLEAGGTKPWSGAIAYDKSMSDHRRLLAADLDSIKADLVVEKISYSNGEGQAADR